ncbi:serine threonine-protein kinase psk1 [Ophiostoma piceae UAMH 11346]|uniref:Serine threonine-protein kinase psk1 n=1 Tax=Ophiostoma piceae (strain UAMH 11346) TaxID=1262450 RepID=S3C648_OPHP1|nr:serine threonine-protein kinase psk1 [Ophiostoma piceae UAMH 11346]
MDAPPPALNTVRGFHGTPMTSGDEDSDQGVNIKRGAGAGVPMERGGSESSVTRRGRKPMPILDDVVSANCSPILRPAGSPAVGGIAKLRMQMDPFTLDTSAASSRASSPGAKTKAAATTATSNASALARVTSPLSPSKARGKENKGRKGQTNPTGQSQLDNLFRSYEKRPDSSTSTKATESDASRVATALSSRTTSHDGISSNTSSDEAGPDTVTSDDMASYVIRLKSDFISESVRDGGAGPLAADDNLNNEIKSAIFEADPDMDDVASTATSPRGRGPSMAGGASGGINFRDDPFGGFSFVASTSLLNESNFPSFME